MQVVVLAAVWTAYSADTSSFLYPNMSFDREGKTTFKEVLGEFDVSPWSFEEFIRETFTNEAKQLLSDPFITNEYRYVGFQSFDAAEKIADFYESRFQDTGWERVRGIFEAERTLCAGDWLSVYKQKDAYVYFHICGPWTDEIIESDRKLVRDIEFRFIGIAPSNLLGEQYREKTGEHEPARDGVPLRVPRP